MPQLRQASWCKQVRPPRRVPRLPGLSGVQVHAAGRRRGAADRRSKARASCAAPPLVARNGPYGRFISCARRPDCKFTKKMTLGITCPDCGQGEIAEKRTQPARQDLLQLHALSRLQVRGVGQAARDAVSELRGAVPGREGDQEGADAALPQVQVVVRSRKPSVREALERFLSELASQCGAPRPHTLAAYRRDITARARRARAGAGGPWRRPHWTREALERAMRELLPRAARRPRARRARWRRGAASRATACAAACWRSDPVARAGVPAAAAPPAAHAAGARSGRGARPPRRGRCDSRCATARCSSSRIPSGLRLVGADRSQSRRRGPRRRDCCACAARAGASASCRSGGGAGALERIWPRRRRVERARRDEPLFPGRARRTALARTVQRVVRRRLGDRGAGLGREPARAAPFVRESSARSAAPTCARSRNCSATARSRARRSTRTSRARGCARRTSRRTRGPEARARRSRASAPRRGGRASASCRWCCGRGLRAQGAAQRRSARSRAAAFVIGSSPDSGAARRAASTRGSRSPSARAWSRAAPARAVELAPRRRDPPAALERAAP